MSEPGQTHIPEPECIQEARTIITNVTKMIDEGRVEQISVYVGLRDGEYAVLQNRNNGRHEDAGRIFELALLRLGFVQRETVDEMIGDSE